MVPALFVPESLVKGVESISDRPKPLPVMARIVVVEDFAPQRALVCSMLSNRPELRIVGEASDGLEAVEKVKELKPDLLLLDISLPGLNGIEAARQIRELVPASKIVFLTQESSPEVMKEAVRLGACGYVLKSEMEIDLLRAIQRVLQGEHFFDRGAIGFDNADQNNQKPPPK